MLDYQTVPKFLEIFNSTIENMYPLEKQLFHVCLDVNFFLKAHFATLVGRKTFSFLFVVLHFFFSFFLSNFKEPPIFEHFTLD